MEMKEIENMFLSAGYLRFDPLRDDYVYTDAYQKKVTDKYGTKYFVNVYIFDLPKVHKGAKRPYISLEVQFHTEDNMNGSAINISRYVETPEEAEQYTEEMWTALNCGYYERNWL